MKICASITESLGAASRDSRNKTCGWVVLALQRKNYRRRTDFVTKEENKAINYNILIYSVSKAQSIASKCL